MPPRSSNMRDRPLKKEKIVTRLTTIGTPGILRSLGLFFGAYELPSSFFPSSAMGISSSLDQGPPGAAFS